MMLKYIISVAVITGAILPNNVIVHSYLIPRPSTPLMISSSSALTSRGHCNNNRWAASRPSMIQLRSVVRSWQPTSSIYDTRSIRDSGISSRSSSTRLSSGSFYDDFEDFSDFDDLGGSSNSDNDEGKKSSSKGGSSDENKPVSASSSSVSGGVSGGVGTGSDDAVMKELRKRMNDLSKQREDDDIYDIDDEDDDDDESYSDSGSALPDLEGNTITNIDDLIEFAQQKAREKKAKSDTDDDDDSTLFSGSGGNTWEDENWARPIPLKDLDSGKEFDIEDLLEGGIVLVANPAKFCSDLADANDDNKSKKGKGKKDNSNSFLGGLFDDPFPMSSSQSSNSISPALLAKFGITLPPSPDLGPDRRADLLPVVMLIGRDDIRGSQAVLMNRRTGNLIGDLPANAFEEDGKNDDDGKGDNPFASHPLSAFMIQPLWWAGSSPGGQNDVDDEGKTTSRGGIRGIDMVHACPYVDGSVPLLKSDGLYWGGSPIQAQEAMKDSRLEKPLSGFDFKFFIQTTRWLPSQVCSYDVLCSLPSFVMLLLTSLKTCMDLNLIPLCMHYPFAAGAGN